jgi:hypothetical protein
MNDGVMVTRCATSFFPVPRFTAFGLCAMLPENLVLSAGVDHPILTLKET